jgi:hypothetical protein
MAGDWIKMRMDLPDDPAVVRIAAAAGISEDEVVGKLHRLWCWADRHTTDGSAPGINSAWVDRYVGAKGFSEAMASAGWLDISATGISFPGFEKHNGQTAKRRADGAVRQRLSRESRDAGVTGVTRDVIPRPFARVVMERDDYRCVYCGAQSTVQQEGSRKSILSIDHIIPVTRGGKTAIPNLACCCKLCNGEKNDRTPEEWGLAPEYLSQGVTYVSHEMCDSRVTESLPREEKSREHKTPPPPTPPKASNGARALEPEWKAVEEDLFRIGVRLAPQAIDAARSNGCSSDEAIDVIAYWRLKTGAWDAGALYSRLLALRPGQDCSSLWPDESPKFQAAARRELASKNHSNVTAERLAGELRREADIAAGRELENRFGPELDAMPRDAVVTLIREKLPGDATFLLKRFPESGPTTGLLRESLIGYLESRSNRS